MHGGLAQRFYENGTPFVLHAAAEYTPWIGGMPEHDTITGESARRIRGTIHDTKVHHRGPWKKKHDKVVFRGGPHGFGSDMYQRDGLTDAQALALLDAEGVDPARAESALECARMNQRVELAVWANSPANELREHVEAYQRRL